MMGKVMTKQAIEQPRTDLQAFLAGSAVPPEELKAPAGTAQDGGKGFEAQLAAAAQMTQVAQPAPQPLPQANAPAEKAGAAPVAQAAVSLNANAAEKTNGRDSAVGLTAIAG